LKISRWYRWTVIAAIVVVIVVALRTCGFGSRLTEPEIGSSEESSLTLQTVTLEQPDENGNLLWRLKAQSVTYSPDNQRAELKGLNGEFFQAGKTIYTVVADEGEVQQNGETLFLRGNLVATSKANELTLEGDRLKWQPKQDRLMMGDFKDDPELVSSQSDSDESDSDESDSDESDRNESDRSESDRDESDSSQSDNSESDSSESDSSESDSSESDSADANRTEVSSAASDSAEPAISKLDILKSNQPGDKKPPVKGFNPEIEVVASLVTVVNQDNRVDLTGGVAAKRKEEPWMTFEADTLTWFTERKRIETQKPIKVEQYEEKAYQKVRDRITGATGQVDLDKNVVTLDKLVQMDLLSQPLKVQSETAIWDVPAQRVDLDKTIKMEQPERKIKASANQAQLDLAEEVVYLTGNVQANGEEKDSQLKADKVTWKTGSQDIEAEGNVSYQQATDPQVSMAGTRAVGNIEQGTVVVTGGENTEGDVVIEFVPEES
jgi:LPS export ABC transporter protein LptC